MFSETPLIYRSLGVVGIFVWLLGVMKIFETKSLIIPTYPSLSHQLSPDIGFGDFLLEGVVLNMGIKFGCGYAVVP